MIQVPSDISRNKSIDASQGSFFLSSSCMVTCFFPSPRQPKRFTNIFRMRRFHSPPCRIPYKSQGKTPPTSYVIYNYSNTQQQTTLIHRTSLITSSKSRCTHHQSRWQYQLPPGNWPESSPKLSRLNTMAQRLL